MPPRKRHVAAVVIGNALEFYDFTTYAYFAAQIGAAFFPSKTPFVSLLASLAAFGIGFAGRPAGGLLIGAYGDRKGRRPAMLLSFALMGIAIIAFVLMPSYAQIGIAAPIGIVLIRLLQGIAVGGDVGPTTAFLLEAAPPERRGFYCALQYSSQGVSTVCAGAVGVALAHALSPAALESYGWRIALGLGALILPIGFAIRRSLPETLEAHDAQAPRILDKRHRRTIVLGFFMLGSTTIGFYVTAFLATFSTQFLHMSATLAFLGTLVFGAANIGSSALAGHLSDRFGRKPLMVVPRALFLLATWPAFHFLVARRDAVSLLSAAFVLGVLGQASVTGFVALSEALPKNLRSASLATTYALAIAIFGGTAQFTVAALTRSTGDLMLPAWYLMAGTAIGLIAMALMDETAPVKLREREWTSGPPRGRELI